MTNDVSYFSKWLDYFSDYTKLETSVKTKKPQKLLKFKMYFERIYENPAK
jgi:hypothetical protein